VSDGLVEKKPLKKLGQLRRQTVSVAADELVRFGRMRDAGDLPALCEPAVGGVDLAAWCRDNRPPIAQRLQQHGAILFRGFGVHTPELLERVVEAVSGELLEYRERSTPRSQVHHNVYTSTDYPPDQSIFPHNENSYQSTFPLKLFFCCEVEGRDVRPQFRRRVGVELAVRLPDLGQGRRGSLLPAGQDGGRLETGRPPARSPRAPGRGATSRDRRGNLVQPRHVLPRHDSAGDGSRDPAGVFPEVLEELRRIYLDERIIFPWRRGDVLLLDNVLTAHAREPYRGERRILTGMAEPWSRDGA
jgi:hypothetical protein